MNFNQVILSGRLCADPEQKVLPGGLVVAEFRLANDRRVKQRDGTVSEEPSFFSCVTYGKCAETFSKYHRKGDLCFVVGKLRQDRWEQEGKNRERVKVAVDSFEFIKTRRDDANPSGSRTVLAAMAPSIPATPQTQPPVADDVPF
jgi:single-strand DNA-binding protein